MLTKDHQWTNGALKYLVNSLNTYTKDHQDSSEKVPCHAVCMPGGILEVGVAAM